MKYRILITGLFALFLINKMQSQYLNIAGENASKTSLTGNLHNDLFMQANQVGNFDGSDNSGDISNKKKYSPLAAGLFSAVLPGTGQFYIKSYWQSAAFFGAEVLTWVIYATYEKKGDRQTDAFQQYADQHWSVAQYANWMNINYGQSININLAPDLKSWQRVSWNDLNNAEDNIGKLTDAQGKPYSGFTHQLAPYSDQQYYEMIGKYSQFGGGWDDAATFTKADVTANMGEGNVSPRFLEYRDMRNQANSYYNIGTTVSYIIVANHIFSALEAALNASRINHRIQLQGHIQSRRIYGNFVEFVPTLHVKYEL